MVEGPILGHTRIYAPHGRVPTNTSRQPLLPLGSSAPMPDDARSSRPRPAPSTARLDPVGEAIRQWKAHGFKSQVHVEAVANINRMSQLLHRSIEEQLRPVSLNFPQYEALVLLFFSREGSLPLGKMGRRLTVHPTTVTNTIDQLERKKLVKREPNPKDRRQVIATITELGRQRVVGATEALARIGHGLKGMSAADARALTDIISSYRAAQDDYV